MNSLKTLSPLFIFFMAILVAVPAQATSHEGCLDCHQEQTPVLVEYWKASAHFGEGITCTDCHGSDVDKAHAGQAPVIAETCGACHKKALEEHQASRHYLSLKTGQGCTRNLPPSPDNPDCTLCHKEDTTVPLVDVECAMFLAQSPSMRRIGCTSCHKVETGCDACHTKHGTSLEHARRAETCGVCHMGPDHAQLEMWRGSQHGVLFAEQGEPLAPTCVTCHMTEGSHNVSIGVATGKPDSETVGHRETMIVICSRCHAPSFAKRALKDADNVRDQSAKLVAEAREIVEALNKEGLLEPSIQERPEHPIFGQQFVIGGHMLYENISRAEAIFFRMMMFYNMSAFKGAYHQSPDYAHWFGNAPLKLALSELKSEAALLRKTEATSKRIDNLSSAPKAPETPMEELKSELRELKDRHLRGELSDEEYEAQKKAVLEKMGF